MSKYLRELDDGAHVAHAKAWVATAQDYPYKHLEHSMRCSKIVNLARANDFEVYRATPGTIPIFQPSLILLGTVHLPEFDKRVASFIRGLADQGQLGEETSLLMESANGKLDRKKTFQLEHRLRQADHAIGVGTYEHPENPSELASTLRQWMTEGVLIDPANVLPAYREGNRFYVHDSGVLASPRPSYFLNQLGDLYIRTAYEFDDTKDKKLLASIKEGLTFDALIRLLRFRAASGFNNRLAQLEFDTSEPLQRPLTIQTFGVLDAMLCRLPPKVASLTLIPKRELLPSAVRDFMKYIETPEPT